MSIRQNRPIVFAQPLEERVDAAAKRQLAGDGPASRAAGRAASEDAKGFWYHDGEDDWTFLGAELPARGR